jgi:hypothetical protein
MEGYHDFTLRRCGAPLGWTAKQGYCRRPAGDGTTHPGVGPCSTHEGGRRGRQAWRLAMEIAGQLDISPWDALLTAVRISAFKVATYEQKIAELTGQHGLDALKPGEMAHDWVQLSFQERRHFARVAKAAVDAGVAERLVRQVELESKIIVRVLGKTLDSLMLSLTTRGFPDGMIADLRLEAHSVAHRELLAIEGPESLKE